MTVREVLEAARDAAMQKRRIQEEKMLRLGQIGPQGYSLGVHPKGDIRDPMRHVDELLDWQDQLTDELELEPTIDEGRAILRGIARVADPVSVEIAVRYYVNAESWREVARAMEGSVEPLRGMPRDHQVTVLSKAMDSTVDSWEAYGIAHLKQMGSIGQ